jgi:CheY-like chemotaxis protein
MKKVAHAPLVLVIDDSEDIRDLFRLALEAAGYRVKVAANGYEGLAVVRESRPDLILTDISMPQMDGFQFLVQLRSDFEPPLPPVVVCSGFDVTANEALRLGAVRFVAKPVEAASLVRIIEEALHHQPPEAAEFSNERAFVQAARARAAAEAARLFATIKEQLPEVERQSPRFAQFIADYFGFAPVVVVFVEGSGSIRVAGTSRDSFVPRGATFSGDLLFTTGVLAAGSSLVVTDAKSFFASVQDERARAMGITFGIAVPLLFEGVPIGALCLLDRATHPFDPEDLLIFEGIGGIGSRELRFIRPIGGNLGFVLSPLFDRMLGAELSLLHRRGGGLELLMVEMDPTVIDSKLALEVVRRGGSRLAICKPESATLTLYKRDSNAAAARSAVSAAMSTLLATGAVRATGWVSVLDEGMAVVPGDVVRRLAASALAQSLSTPHGPVQHTSIVGGPTPGVAAEANPSPEAR